MDSYVLWAYIGLLFITVVTTNHTAVAVSTSWWFLKGMSTDSPTKKFPSIPPAKQRIIDATQHDNGCFLENSVEPETNREKCQSQIRWSDESLWWNVFNQGEAIGVFAH